MQQPSTLNFVNYDPKNTSVSKKRKASECGSNSNKTFQSSYQITNTQLVTTTDSQVSSSTLHEKPLKKKKAEEWKQGLKPKDMGDIGRLKSTLTSINIGNEESFVIGIQDLEKQRLKADFLKALIVSCQTYCKNFPIEIKSVNTKKKNALEEILKHKSVVLSSIDVVNEQMEKEVFIQRNQIVNTLTSIPKPNTSVCLGELVDSRVVQIGTGYVEDWPLNCMSQLYSEHKISFQQFLNRGGGNVNATPENTAPIPSLMTSATNNTTTATATANTTNSSVNSSVTTTDISINTTNSSVNTVASSHTSGTNDNITDISAITNSQQPPLNSSVNAPGIPTYAELQLALTFATTEITKWKLAAELCASERDNYKNQLNSFNKLWDKVSKKKKQIEKEAPVSNLKVSFRDLDIILDVDKVRDFRACTGYGKAIRFILTQFGITELRDCDQTELEKIVFNLGSVQKKGDRQWNNFKAKERKKQGCSSANIDEKRDDVFVVSLLNK